MSAYANGAQPRAHNDDSDVEEEVLVAEYREQQQFEHGLDDIEQNSAAQPDDIQARLAAAAQPLDYSATLDVKFQSYDAYCSLFHYILNSEGPIDLEPPSVSSHHTIASDWKGRSV